MDAEEVLLRMTAENIFNTTEEERIKGKLTRSEKNEQLLDILPSKGEKAYKIFKETLQEVHPHLANIILQLETTSIPQEIKNSIIHEFLVSEEGFTEDCTILTHLNQIEVAVS
ncbi:unnamed protein product [Pocillopora meandrina]|uniref:CARD domain-containing protein n=1 Tax=Pocillopora meandrina TaxID=46732 RepID=A0AAU9WWE6_9CNID|nr:unnamed protein product [Pocillopora meandrina]